MPVEKKLSALEEAEYEDDGGEEGALEREMLSQCEFLFFQCKVIMWIDVGGVSSYANLKSVQTACGYPWSCWDGSRVYWSSGFASS